MRRISDQPHEALHRTAATRDVEQRAAKLLPPHTLMARAGASVGRLTLALAPHAHHIWVACGPGNNGGDGLVAATWLQQHSQAHGRDLRLCVTLAADAQQLPQDAAWALRQALAAGIQLAAEPPETFDFAIDALLGIGATRPMTGQLLGHWQRLARTPQPTLSVDVPSGLHADTGALLSPAPTSSERFGHRSTLSLLTLKPGLFTAQGRDFAGTVWLDDLDASSAALPSPDAWLRGRPQQAPRPAPRHAAHKGSQGEVLVIGGQGVDQGGIGMSGAAVLAARAALHAGAGRVYLSLLQSTAPTWGWDPACPELMLRSPTTALEGNLVERSVVVCGCGGGSAIAEHLPTVLRRANTLVLDADALNAIASQPLCHQWLADRRHRTCTTVLTPHPLEAARLLGTATEHVMADRLATAQAISDRWGVICVLKGSGTVICAPGATPWINASGNGLLATAGTGDALAGMIGATLATHTQAPVDGVAEAVFEHGRIADQWLEAHGARGFTAGVLTRHASH